MPKKKGRGRRRKGARPAGGAKATSAAARQRELGTWELLAVQGDAEAQRCLGYCFANGQIVGRNDEESAHWFKLAAEQGDVDAQCELAVCYAVGRGLPVDTAECARWYRVALGSPAKG